MSLKQYDSQTKEIICRVINDGKNIHLVSDRALGPGEPHFHAYEGPGCGYSRIEASTDGTLKVPGLPEALLKLLSWLPVQRAKLAMTTYLKTLTLPEGYEIEEYLERGLIFLGVATEDGKSDGNTCVVLQPKQ